MTHWWPALCILGSNMSDDGEVMLFLAMMAILTVLGLMAYVALR